MKQKIDVTIRLTKPQEDFVFSDAKFPAFVGGYGAGKSEALVTRLLLLKLENPHGNVGYFAPTYPIIRMVGWSKFQLKLDQWHIPYQLNKQEGVIKLGHNLGNIFFITMDNPDMIIGYDITDAGIDELDTLRIHHAQAAWGKVISRCRTKKKDGKPNTCAVATTPEGYKFVYEQWGKEKKSGYHLIKAPTRSNPYLPKDYIDGLKATYSAKLLDAYLEGEFVNLMHGQPIDTSWFQSYDEDDAGNKILPILEYKAIFADTAQKVKEHNDYSVFQCWGMGIGGELILLDQMRGKWEAYELERNAIAFWEKNKISIQKEKLRGFYIEDKISGTDLIQRIRREGRIPVKAIIPVKDKLERFYDVQLYMEMKRVYLPRVASWLYEFLSECTAFSADMKHKHDDQVDVMVYALAEMIEKKHVPVDWSKLKIGKR